MTLRTLTTAFTMALAASAPQASAMEAMRCNVQTAPGLFQPVLRLVEPGKIEDIRMGEQGLTRTMFFRDREIMAYLNAKLDLPPMQMPKSISKGCGVGKSDTTFQGGEGDGGAVTVSTPAISEPSIPSASEDPSPISDLGDGDFGSIFE
ncbi:hypothetical protein [Litoreibacter ponti]|nr:hypothetical protein [Litoreibacter ponti]